MTYIGIDPGKSGGIVILYDRRDLGERHVAFHALSKLTDFDIWCTIAEAAGMDVVAVLERVHAMPKQGVSSTFKFGRSFGMLEAFLIAAGIRYELVPPSTWQRAMGCLSKGDKNVTKAKAQQLFPAYASKITHAVADAFILAEYARLHGDW